MCEKEWNGINVMRYKKNRSKHEDNRIQEQQKGNCKTYNNINAKKKTTQTQRTKK